MRVSIHAFRGEGDQRANCRLHVDGWFQSTPSGGKATNRCTHTYLRTMFQSTPSGGKATAEVRAERMRVNVSIHAFRGEGDGSRCRVPPKREKFQSTPSGGKATRAGEGERDGDGVSIHAFRGEGDVRHPTTTHASQAVSIHAFRGEGDAANTPCMRVSCSFNPRLPGGRRQPAHPVCE